MLFVDIDADDHDVLFIADLHIGHKRIASYETSTRHQGTLHEMDEHVIATLNMQTTPRTKLFIIGDISFYKNKDKATALLSQIQGEKYLILGNHDYHMQEYYAESGLFKDVADIACVRFNAHDEEDNQRLVLSHYAATAWYNMQHGYIQVHGHEHGSPTHIKGKSIDVGYDYRGGCALSLDNIVLLTKHLPVRKH